MGLELQRGLSEIYVNVTGFYSNEIIKPTFEAIETEEMLEKNAELLRDLKKVE